MSFNIGDTIWIAQSGTEQVWITCPHCFGKKFLTVILGDDSKVTLACECCKEGYDGCRGQIQEYQFVAKAQEITVDNIESRDGKMRYNYHDERNCFATKEDALKRAEEFRLEHESQEKNRMFHKCDQKKTWAWNVSYHRSELKRALHNVEYHTGALDFAKTKIKQE